MTNFDTYTFIKALQDTGMPERQAKAISDGLKNCHESSDYVTKLDIACLEARLDKKISDVLHRQTKMLGGMMIGAITLMTFLDRYLPSNFISVSKYFSSYLT
jgi:hypothetical protein